MGIKSKDYFYYETTRKLVTVFGAMFNNIHTGRKLSDGTLANMERVPLSYGPRSKFLARITERKAKDNISVRLPRMSFEISGLAYDTASKLKKNNIIQYCDPVGKAFAAVPYNISFELNIFGRTQDDMLQILEQILPMFNPDYTISIKGLEGPGTTTSVPFILGSVNLNDDYEGELNPVRALVYTLSFSAKIRYLGPINNNVNLIKTAVVSVYDSETENFFKKNVAKGDDEGEIILNEISFVDSRDEYRLILDTNDTSQIQIGSEVVGETSSYGGIVQTNNQMDVITITNLDNLFEPGENIIDSNGNLYQILDIAIQK